MKYPDYTGSLLSTGTIVLGHRDNGVVISYTLENVDQRCNRRNTTLANSCGLHIHSGFSCATDAEVGGHYYNTSAMADPWAFASYYEVSGNTSVGKVEVQYGHSVEDTEGRVFVIHDYEGRRVSCGVLPATTDSVTLGKFGAYLNYTGSMRPTGCLSMQFRSTSVQINYNISGVDSRCTARNTSALNSCGIHIHAGNTCDTAGPHYYNPSLFSSDPWANVSYIVQSQTQVQGVFNVEFGYNFVQTAGRSVVIHDFQGNRAACVSIPFGTDRLTTPLPPLSAYPGYNGSLNITGSVRVDFRGNGAKISFDLNGTDAGCPGTAPNSCGIHIHSGFSCADAQGHYFDVTKFPTDPWARAVYFSNSSMSQGAVVVSYGYGFVESSGRVVVLHGFDGSRVACAVIPTVSDSVTAFFQSSINMSGSVQLDFRATSVRLAYNLHNVTTNCSVALNQSNSCTLQIVEGTCAALGKHHFKTLTDPWLQSHYVSVGQAAIGHLDVENGYNLATTQGCSLIINDQQGAVAACSPISMGSGFQGGTPVIAAGLADIRGGNITGSATVLFKGLGGVINYELFGVDPLCEMPGSALNSCGIHIHTGFDCSSSGGHFFDPIAYPLDPWSYSTYTADGYYSQGSVVVSYGKDVGATQGRTLVVHNFDGTKAACASFPEATDRVVVYGFKQFPQVNSTYSTIGDISMDFRATSVRIQYTFSNADVRCAGGPQPNVSNSCGLHVHAGPSCDSPEAAGPHYYDPSYKTDPWAPVAINITSTGDASGTLNVEFGYGYSQSQNRPVVVHDWTGARISCALIPIQQGNTAPVLVEVPQTTLSSNYTGPYDVKFQNVAITFKGDGSLISYYITGVPCECSMPGMAPNSCALHIQDTNFTSWYNHNKSFSVDPWTTVRYTATSCSSTCYPAVNATAEGILVVSFGYGYPETKNKMLSIYDYFGELMGTFMISIPVIPSPSLDATGTLPVPVLRKYPNYLGGLNISGNLLLKHVNNTVKITFSLEGVESECSAFDPTVPTSCGISIHTGFSCDNDTNVGSEFYNFSGVSTNPWLTNVAKYISSGSNASGSIGVDYGYSIDLTKGRVIVISDFRGNRAACAVLPSTTDSVTLGKIGKLINQANDVTGCINMNFRGSSVNINFDIAGVDPKCTSRSQFPNSCGLHIHSNTTCESAALVGPHYFAGPQDPWSNISYKVLDGRARGDVDVEFGYGFDASQGRAVVVHDFYGNKTHCVLLPFHQIRETAVLPPLELYPGYNGTLNITGAIKLDFRGQGVKISYKLSGTESDCSVPGPAANSCGIHIHEGFSCANAGGHFYNKNMYASDPWAVAPYIADTNFTSYSLIVSFGYDYLQSAGRVVVVHAYDGTRVSCAVIPALTDSSMVSQWKSFNASKVNGSVFFAFRPTSVRMEYYLMGLDSRCAVPGTGNSCGLHIHTGTSCDTTASIGADYYVNNTIDPWQAVHISGPHSSGFFDVEFGFAYAATKGRVIVVHDYDGFPLACAVIPGGSTSPRNTVSVVSFSEKTDPGLSGKFVLNFANSGVRIRYDLTGVDTNCSAPGPAQYSCGLYIEVGLTCNASNAHLFLASQDPWTYATYTSLGSIAQGSFILETGFSFGSSMGRTIALYNYAGMRVGCAIIPETTKRVKAGMVTLDFRESSVRLTYNIANADSRCVTRKPQVNASCAIRILTGTCTPGKEGGDYYQSAWPIADPWESSFYVYANNQSQGVLEVENGYTFQESVGHALAIYNYDGNITTCTLILDTVDEQKAGDIALGTYPGYSGSYVPTFSYASVDFSGDGAAISYNLGGVPCECSEIGPAANSCGLHIHDGSSCDAANAIGGHWYNHSIVPVDPWSFTPYVAMPCSTSCSSGSSSASGTLTVSFGYSGAESLSKVLVVHDYQGNRIGCSQIQIPAKPTSNDSYLILPFLITIGALLLILVVGVFVQNRKKSDPRGSIHQALLADSSHIPGKKGRGMSVNEA